MISIDSLRSLPPKQALALLLAHKAKMVKKRTEEETAREIARKQYRQEGVEELPSFADVPSLVLDPSHKLYCLLHQRALQDPVGRSGQYEVVGHR